MGKRHNNSTSHGWFALKWMNSSPWFRPLCICLAFRKVVFVLILYCTPSHLYGHVTSPANGQLYTIKINKEFLERSLNRVDTYVKERGCDYIWLTVLEQYIIFRCQTAPSLTFSLDLSFPRLLWIRHPCGIWSSFIYCLKDFWTSKS